MKRERAGIMVASRPAIRVKNRLNNYFYSIFCCDYYHKYT